MVRTLHAAGIEVILDVVYNHTAEGSEFGPTLSFRGIDNAAYYRLVPDAPAPLPGLHRLRQHPQHAAPAGAAAADGFAALLGHRDACRRLPLRPGLGAGARAVRGRPAQRLLRRAAPGPGAVAGQADRRALGPGLGRLPGRQLPGRLGRVERQVPRHHARLLEGRRRPDRRIRPAPDRQQRPLQPQQPPALRQHQFHRRPRRLHAGRPGVLQRQAQRGQWRGQPRRPRPQPVLELRRRGPDRRRRRAGAARAPAAQLHRHAAAVARRADAAGRRRTGPQPAGQQQRLLPGQRPELGRLDVQPGAGRAAGLHQPHDRPCARRTRCSGGAIFSRTGR